MRLIWIIFYGILFMLISPYIVNSEVQSNDERIAYPDIPRISAYEAYKKYKEGKAIIIHAGGMSYEKRHIAGAYNYSVEEVKAGIKTLPDFPRDGIEIFTYCY